MMSGSPSSDADAVVFDIEADYGHFRKPHTAPAAETYGIMPRTAVAGLCAAMLGMPRDSYYDTFSADNSRIAVSVEAPVRRRVGGMNYLDTQGLKSKTGGAQTAKHIESHRDPTPVARLSEPRYRIFVSVDDAETMDALDAVARGADPDPDVEGDAPVYGPSMGPAQHLAWIEYVGRFPIEREHETDAGDDGTVAIRSAVPGEELPLVVDPDHRYVSERMTAFMAADESVGGDGRGRVPDGSHTITYERSGEPLTLRAADADYATVGSDHVVFS